MSPEEWSYALAEEAFACGHEPRVLGFADGTKVILTSWATDEYGTVRILNEPHLVQKLHRCKDDLGAWNYTMSEYDPKEYNEWLRACKEARDVLPAPPSYHDGIDVPDFIGAELWEEHVKGQKK